MGIPEGFPKPQQPQPVFGFRLLAQVARSKRSPVLRDALPQNRRLESDHGKDPGADGLMGHPHKIALRDAVRAARHAVVAPLP